MEQKEPSPPPPAWMSESLEVGESSVKGLGFLASSSGTWS